MKTQELARGAMCTAIYGVLLLINQQTSLFIETSLSWLFVFPILIYAALYGAYPGGIAAIAMALLSFLFGGFTTWFYSWSSLLMGYLYGVQIHRQSPPFTRFATLFFLCIAANTCIMGIWAAIFGVDYREDMEMLRKIAPWLSLSAYMAALILLMSFLQAICIHMISFIICSRLKIKTVAFPSLDSLRPKRWVGIFSLVLWAGCGFILSINMIEWSKGLENILVVILFSDLIILEYYGALFFFRKAVERKKRWIAAAAVLGAFVPGLNLLWALIGEIDALKAK